MSRIKEKAKAYLNRFRKEEDGMELLEWAILIIIVVGLVAVAVYIGGIVTDKLNEAANEINSLGAGTTAPGGAALPPNT